MYDVIIIGAGCAGMTAAVYALRAGCTVLILESEGIGGQIAYSPRVENFPSVKQISGQQFADNLYEQARALGASFEFETVTRITDGVVKRVTTEYAEYTCGAVIVATGVKNRPLPLDGAEGYVGRGLSYCAVCDGVFYKGGDVCVVGGGNTALSDAIYLSQFCRRVYLIHRRHEFRGDDVLVATLSKVENAELVLGCTVTELHGTDSLSAVTVTSTADGASRVIAVQGLFCAIGQIPQNSPFSPPLTLDSDGFIPAGEDCRTNVAGIFAAGDCRAKKLRQLTTAASDGASSGFGAAMYIKTNR